MNRRLLYFLILLLLASAALAYYATYEPPAPTPKVETPAAPPPKPAEPVTPPTPPAAVDTEKPKTRTLRTELKEHDLVTNPQTPEASITLKKKKAREILPGVTIENKELQVQLEEVNESINIRRSEGEQVEVIWKQKF